MSFTDPAAPVPTILRTDKFLLRPITPADAPADHAALMETREQLRRWEQATWPEDDFSVEANREDLVGLEERHAAHRAFTYTVVDPVTDECLGCVYLFPTDATFLTKATVTPTGEGGWDSVDVVVYFWVRKSRMQTGMDSKLLDVLRAWLMGEWKLSTAVFVVSDQFAEQIELLEHTDLTKQFEIVEPGKVGRFSAYG